VGLKRADNSEKPEKLFSYIYKNVRRGRRRERFIERKVGRHERRPEVLRKLCAL
jgi:hypothetical protein